MAFETPAQVFNPFPDAEQAETVFPVGVQGTDVEALASILHRDPHAVFDCAKIYRGGGRFCMFENVEEQLPDRPEQNPAGVFTERFARWCQVSPTEMT